MYIYVYFLYIITHYRHICVYIHTYIHMYVDIYHTTDVFFSYTRFNEIETYATYMYMRYICSPIGVMVTRGHGN